MMFARSKKTGDMTTKAVLLVLGELVDDTGITFRDQSFLAEILECSRATINRALKKLEEAGLIAREQRYEDDTHKRKADVIHLRLDQQSHVTQSYTDPPEPCNSESQSHVTESYSLKDNLTTKQERTPEPLAEGGPEQAPDGALFSVEDDSEQYRPLCLRLAGHVEANLGTKVTVKKNWLDACRRMLTVDERDPGQVEALMDWALQEPFWKERIQSMESFRKHYVSAWGQYKKHAEDKAVTEKEAFLWTKEARTTPEQDEENIKRRHIEKYGLKHWEDHYARISDPSYSPF